MRSMLVACVAALLLVGAYDHVLGQEPSKKPAAAAAEKEGTLQRLLKLLTLPKRVISTVLRGSETRGSGTVVIGRFERGRWVEQARSARNDLRSPLYDPRNRRLIVLHPSGLGTLSLRGELSDLGSIAGTAAHAITALIGWDCDGHLVALAADDWLYFLKLTAHGVSTVPAPEWLNLPLSHDESQQLMAASRTCEQRTLEVRELTAGNGTKRRVVGLRKSDGDIWTSLSDGVKGYIHDDPAFIDSCKGVAFVAAF